jgi:dsRNA-specific ribonuclease
MEDKDLELIKQLKKEENEKLMLTFHIPERGNDFIYTIKKVLNINGKIKDQYLDLLLTDDSLKIYNNVFTSNSITSFRKDDKIVIDEKDTNNYDIYKILGDNIFENFFVWYIVRKFPQLTSANDVKTIARMKINYGPKHIFYKFAEDLGFEKYISASLYLYNNEKQKKVLLTEVMSSFIGATAVILDEKLSNGVGYAVCYDILESLFNKENLQLPSKFEELNDPKTTLKEFFDKNKHIRIQMETEYATNLKLLPYEHVFDKENKINKITIYIDGFGSFKNYKIQIGKAEDVSKKDAEKKAAINAINYLDSLGLWREISKKELVREPGKDSIKYGNRNPEYFRDVINKVLLKGNIQDKYKNILLSSESLEIYNKAFTSNTANLNEFLIQDKDSSDNYEVYETLGDTVFKTFIGFYSIKRFPELNATKDVKIISRIKIKYGAEEEFSNLSKNMGFGNLITSSMYEFNNSELRNKMLEDVFESFLGATCYIIDSNVKYGIGYSICYNILKSIFDDISISTDYMELNDPISILKEFIDKNNKTFGNIEYMCYKSGTLHYCQIIRVHIDGITKNRIANGTGNTDKIAKNIGAKNAITELKLLGYDFN